MGGATHLVTSCVLCLSQKHGSRLIRRPATVCAADLLLFLSVEILFGIYSRCFFDMHFRMHQISCVYPSKSLAWQWRHNVSINHELKDVMGLVLWKLKQTDVDSLDPLLVPLQSNNCSLQQCAFRQLSSCWVPAVTQRPRILLLILIENSSLAPHPHPPTPPLSSKACVHMT